jgi:hypothetical protein
MYMLICTLCSEPCIVLIDGDFCEACWNGPVNGQVEAEV